jgi:Zn-dependent M28 family amino/carboxypeptidase
MHLEGLTAIGPRVAGSEGAERAREYLRGQLEAIGAEVIEHRLEIQREGEEQPVELVHLTGVLAGDSPDVFMLAAPYDTFPMENFEFVGANSGASGPALLLELGRVLSAAKRTYTIWLSFLDGEALPKTVGGSQPGYLGSRALAAELAEQGRLPQIRLGFFFDQVADPDLRIARDLRSHRAYREMLWSVAAEVGRGEAFPASAGFESPKASHHAFLEKKLHRVVAIVDNRHGGAEEPGIFWHSEDDDLAHASPESLSAVGEVTVEALMRIQERLLKIDRVARPRTPEPPAAPGSE